MMTPKPNTATPLLEEIDAAVDAPLLVSTGSNDSHTHCSCAAYGRVCPRAAQTAARAACEALRELQTDSNIFCKETSFHFVHSDELSVGELLGQGGFSNVNTCVLKDRPEENVAVKYLKRRAMVDLHHFKHGASDLATEAFFLQALSHPHIVQLHGVTAGSVATNVASGQECGFFIVIDRLHQTLEEWLEEHRPKKASANKLLRFSSAEKDRQHGQLVERIRMALQIAEAMQYLHSRNIVYRDLKPDNIGFNESDTLKLFDFGLAKELKSGMERDDGKFELTGNTGSRRYMAPEVAKEAHYDKSVDVYSFGILLWELCSGEKPFYGYSSGKHMQQVVLGGERPPMDSLHTYSWPTNLQWLLHRCWSPDPSSRPSFELIREVLQDVAEGKTILPASVLAASEPSPASPNGGFGSLFQPLSRKKDRSKTTGSTIDPAKEGSFHLKPLPKSARRRSWAFGHRR